MTFSERVWRWLAWKTPHGLVYWCAIRLMAHATQGPWSNQEVPALLAMDALKRWETQPPKDYDRKELELRATCGLG